MSLACGAYTFFTMLAQDPDPSRVATIRWLGIAVMALRATRTIRHLPALVARALNVGAKSGHADRG